MRYTQRRNRLTTHFSECVPVVKRRIPAYVFFETLQRRRWGFLSSAIWRGMAGQLNSDFSRQRVFLLGYFAPWPWGKILPRIFFIRLPCDAASYPRRTGSCIYSCKIYRLQKCRTDCLYESNKLPCGLTRRGHTLFDKLNFIHFLTVLNN